MIWYIVSGGRILKLDLNHRGNTFGGWRFGELCWTSRVDNMGLGLR